MAKKTAQAMTIPAHASEVPDPKHSPGPFRAGSKYDQTRTEIEDNRGRCIALVWTHRSPNVATVIEDPQGMANLRLLAGSFELLQAARQALLHAQLLGSGQESPYSHAEICTVLGLAIGAANTINEPAQEIEPELAEWISQASAVAHQRHGVHLEDMEDIFTTRVYREYWESSFTPGEFVRYYVAPLFKRLDHMEQRAKEHATPPVPPSAPASAPDAHLDSSMEDQGDGWLASCEAMDEAGTDD